MRSPDYPNARWIGAPRDEANRKVAKSVGVLAHTTGANADDLKAYKQLVTKDIAAARRAVDQRKINVYDAVYPQGSPKPVFPHYLVPLDDTGPETWQIAPEEDRSWAQGLGDAAIHLYNQGDDWRRYTKELDQQTKKKIFVDHGKILDRYDDWLRKWPGHKNPGELWDARKLPGDDPNQLISVEFVQNLDVARGSVTFTMSQHIRGARLLTDIARRHGFYDDLLTQARAALGTGGVTMGWPPALMSHSDSDPISRSNDKQGGWDPGHMMDWSYLWKLILQS